MLAKCKFQNLSKSSSKKDDWNSEKDYQPITDDLYPWKKYNGGSSSTARDYL
jgi:hypothetical protein